ncbi:MAG: hypothetical protein IT275_09215 [Chitinophagales bacterium]|nr:hypothetical protein [Chitinophagales bacterium]
MKKSILCIAIASSIALGNAGTSFASNKTTITKATSASISVKLKNDGDDEISVINAGSGGTYRLQKNIVTTIKMDEGDKLYIYEKGKKGALLLVASPEMDGKVQLLSKL